MNKKKIDYGKTYRKQDSTTVGEVIDEVPAIISYLIVKMLKNYPRFIGSVWVTRFEMLIGDVIENKRRRINRLSNNPSNGPTRKGRPPNPNKRARRADGSRDL